jgi:uncharacterized protein YbcI
MSEEALGGGRLAAGIANAVVRRLGETTGRGPTKARTTLGQDVILVVVQDTLTRGERVLVEHGDHELVLAVRRRWQDAMRDDVTRDIEELTGREVIGFMSDNYIEPDVGAEIFVLEPIKDHGAMAEGDSDR